MDAPRRGLAIVGLVTIAYLSAWPVDIDPAAWEPPRAPAPEGIFALNDELSRCEIFARMPGLDRLIPIEKKRFGLHWLGLWSKVAFTRWDLDGSAAVVCIANLKPVTRHGYRVGLPWGGRWDVIIDTDDASWWGSGHRGDEQRSVTGVDEAWQSLGSSALIDIGPMSMVWLGSKPPA